MFKQYAVISVSISKMTNTSTLTLEELGRMQGASPEEVYTAREHFREGLESLGIAVQDRPGEFYDKLVTILVSKSGLPVYFEGEGLNTHLVIGDHSNGVVVE